MSQKLDLVCPAGSLPAFKAAIAAGADAVYLGFRDNTNARHFAGLNFNDKQLAEAVELAHTQSRRVYLALNTYPEAGETGRWRQAVDRAARLGVDAVILADIGLLQYAADHHPTLRRHLSVQASVTSPEALNFIQRLTGISRAVLPRVLSLKQVKNLCAHTQVEIEVFGFGSLCIMAEGRCHLSSWMTGESPNTSGVCSPAKFVDWQQNADGSMDTRLNGVLIDHYQADENAAYPTLCKGRFEVSGNTFHALEEPTSLNTLDLLPELATSGVCAIKIEGRQRSPAYISKVATIWRQAIDRVNQGNGFQLQDEWMEQLGELAEGSVTTLGAYHRSWQ